MLRISNSYENLKYILEKIHVFEDVDKLRSKPIGNLSNLSVTTNHIS